MSLNEYTELLMFVFAFGLILLGFPVAFTLAGVALGFAVIGEILGVFQIRQLNFMPQCRASTTLSARDNHLGRFSGR